MIHKVLEMEV